MKKARVLFKKTDVTDWEQLQITFDECMSEFGSLDIVCPGAGTFEPVRLSSFSSLSIDRSFFSLSTHGLRPFPASSSSLSHLTILPV